MNAVEKRPVTSASNLYRRKLCPGSARMEAPFPDSDNEYSAEGTLLHRSFMRESKDELSPDLKEVVSTANRLGKEFVDRFWEEFVRDATPARGEYEKSMSASFVSGSELTGTCDCMISWGRNAVVLDAKFGYADVDDAPDNLQLAAYALMACCQDSFERVGVAIIQPRSFTNKVTSAVYTWHGLKQAEAEIDSILNASKEWDAPLSAGDHCRYCKAKAVCPAYQGKLMQVQTVDKHAVQTLTNDRLTDVFEAIKFARSLEPDVKKEVRTRIENETLPGWKLQPTGNERVCSDTMGLFQAMTGDEGVLTPQEFQDCMSVSYGDLEKKVREKTGWTIRKSQEYVRNMSAPFTVEKPKSPTPKKV